VVRTTPAQLQFKISKLTLTSVRTCLLILTYLLTYLTKYLAAVFQSVRRLCIRSSVIFFMANSGVEILSNISLLLPARQILSRRTSIIPASAVHYTAHTHTHTRTATWHNTRLYIECHQKGQRGERRVGKWRRCGGVTGCVELLAR